MTPENFCYWMQGFFELHGAGKSEATMPVLGHEQIACIKNHLNMVFIHSIDPGLGGPEMQGKLTAAHLGNPSGSTTPSEMPSGSALIRC